MIQFELPENNNASIIKVIGVGGGGGNAVNYMNGLGIEGVDFIVCNTDKKALNNSTVPTKIQLGPSLTQGLGAGANPEVGMRACEESISEIEDLLANSTKMVFVTAGMGGGTGTGGAPIVAKVAKDLDILTVGIVTTPFSYEGKKRMRQAEEGIAKMRENVDTILIISNDKLRHQFGNIPTSQAFSKADDILATATKCITDVINSQGHIVVDFADVCTVMENGGSAILGSATASGENRAYDAVEAAINSPLLNDNSIKGAKWVLLNVNSAHGVYEHTLDEVEIIQAYIEEQTGEDCDVIFGTGFDDNLGDKISVTLIATGFEHNTTEKAYNTQHLKPSEEKNKIVHNLEDVLEQPETTIPSFENSNKEDLVAQEENILQEEPQIFLLEDINESTNNEEITPSVNEVVMEEIPTLIDDQSANHIISENEDSFKDFNTLNNLNTQSNTTEEIISSNETKIVFELEPTVPDDFETTSATKNENELSVQNELDSYFKGPINEQNDTIAYVEKSQQQMQDEFVTINGITLNRRKGNRLLTDMELEAEANFELQKRALEERAGRLRTMSFNVNNADIENNENNIPSYQRNNISLDTHPSSADNSISQVKVNGGNISTINTFLNGNNPD